MKNATKAPEAIHLSTTALADVTGNTRRTIAKYLADGDGQPRGDTADFPPFAARCTGRDPPTG